MPTLLPRFPLAALCLRVLWAALLGVCAVGHAAEPARRFSDAFSPEDCGLFKFEAKDAGALCGFVSVPLRHGEAGSPRIRLAVVIIPALVEPARRQQDPLFLAQGGPGGSTISTFAQMLVTDPDKRPTLNRDIVL